MALLAPVLSVEARQSLTRSVSFGEVEASIRSMKFFKASVAIGFQAFFYKEYWLIENWIRKLEEEENREDRGNSSMSIHA
ncbi:hypothetical protein PIB30_099110 [Stylosanthes scabra]|uniref:Uncharacterized protein n=1 Tax=Stylosanthes scabra TaxID=79078 RepID=A0ABU6QXC3_9FABA|nr:hypothetical protein [Stylosanthes scabra]